MHDHFLLVNPLPNKKPLKTTLLGCSTTKVKCQGYKSDFIKESSNCKSKLEKISKVLSLCLSSLSVNMAICIWVSLKRCQFSYQLLSLVPTQCDRPPYTSLVYRLNPTPIHREACIKIIVKQLSETVI